MRAIAALWNTVKVFRRSAVDRKARLRGMPRAVLPTLAATLAVALSGCDTQGDEDSRVTVTVAGAPWPGGLAAQFEAEATGPTLIAHDSSGAIVPGLATSWRFVDNDHGLILRLRPAKWDDGSPLGSNEVVAALRRAAVRGEPALAHAGIAAAADIAARMAPAARLGVRAPISRVVEIRLAAPSPSLLGWLADPALAVVRPGTGKGSLAAYTATGPADDRLLTRRGATATPATRPASIAITSVADTAAAVTRFARGESDIVVGDGLAGLGDARTVARPQTLQVESLWGVYGYVANTRRGPLANGQLRLALSLATDREALRGVIGVAAMAPVTGLLPPALAQTAAPPPAPDAEAVPATAPDDMAARLTKALTVLARTRGPTAAALRLNLLLPPGREHRLIAERVAADWRQLGIEVVVSEASPADIAEKVRRGTFDLALTEASLAVADPAALLARWRCSGGLVCDPAADALWEKARIAPVADRPALLAAAEAKWLEAPPMLPLLTPLRWALVSRRVDGWVANPAGVHPLGRLAFNGRRGN